MNCSVVVKKKREPKDPVGHRRPWNDQAQQGTTPAIEPAVQVCQQPPQHLHHHLLSELLWGPYHCQEVLQYMYHFQTKQLGWDCGLGEKNRLVKKTNDFHFPELHQREARHIDSWFNRKQSSKIQNQFVFSAKLRADWKYPLKWFYEIFSNRKA